MDPEFIDLSRYDPNPFPPDTERAWAAGFFDGEGHFTIGSGKYLRLVVVQTETTTLERFQRATGGYGHIYLRSNNQPAKWKQGWSFQLNALGDVTYAVNLLWEFLSHPKRQQIAAAYSKRAAYRRTWAAEFPLPQQRLSNAEVAAIRVKLAAGRRTQRAIAAEFGVSEYLVSKIKHGKRRASSR